MGLKYYNSPFHVNHSDKEAEALCREVDASLLIDFEIGDEAVKIRIDHYLKVPSFMGSAALCPSDLDWHGYTDIDYSVLNEHGQPLESEIVITEAINEEVEQAISDHMAELEREYEC